MTRLTDIRTPEHYHGGKKPAKRSFFKTFFKVITAPIWGPFYLVYLLLRAIKNLIVKIVIAFWRGLMAVGRGIALALLAVQKAFAAIKIAVAGFLGVIVLAFKSLIFEFIPRFFPTNWAAWLVFLLAITVIWQMAVTWNLPLLNILDSNSDKWQAVFLSNSQVYFGHLKNSRGNTATLEDVFYLRNREGAAGGADLVRLGNGNELHGPENTLFIPREQIIFWENLRADSQVVQAIKQVEDSN